MVIAQLKEAHVVINELYSLMPGYLAVEAMAARCVVLTSASEVFENSLPTGSNDAWIVVNQVNIEQILESVLSDKSKWSSQAERGFHWAETYAHTQKSAVNFEDQLNRKLISGV
jgi:hypothetical protein